MPYKPCCYVSRCGPHPRDLWRILVRARRKTLAILLFLTGSAVPTMSTLAVVGTAGKQLGQVLGAGRDALAMLAGRSPGRREAGLTSSKPAYAPGMRPTERVLSGVRERPTAAPAAPDQMIDNVLGNLGLPPAAEDIPFLPGAGGPGDATTLAPGLLGPVGETPASALTSGPFGPFGLMSNSGNSGNPGSDEATNTPVTTPVAPAGVPEPSTWITMIAGFGMIGAAMRRRRGAAARTAGPAVVG